MQKTALVMAAIALAAAACDSRDERPTASVTPGPTPSVVRKAIGDLPDPDIAGWFLGRSRPADPELAALVDEILADRR